MSERIDQQSHRAVLRQLPEAFRDDVNEPLFTLEELEVFEEQSHAEGMVHVEADSPDMERPLTSHALDGTWTKMILPSGEERDSVGYQDAAHKP